MIPPACTGLTLRMMRRSGPPRRAKRLSRLTRLSSTSRFASCFGATGGTARRLNSRRARRQRGTLERLSQNSGGVSFRVGEGRFWRLTGCDSGSSVDVASTARFLLDLSSRFGGITGHERWREGCVDNGDENSLYAPRKCKGCGDLTSPSACCAGSDSTRGRSCALIGACAATYRLSKTGGVSPHSRLSVLT